MYIYPDSYFYALPFILWIQISMTYYFLSLLVVQFCCWEILIFFSFFFLVHTLGHVELPQLGIEPTPSAVEQQSLNHWTTREATDVLFFFSSDDEFWYDIFGMSQKNLYFSFSFKRFFFPQDKEFSYKVFSSSYSNFALLSHSLHYFCWHSHIFFFFLFFA